RRGREGGGRRGGGGGGGGGEPVAVGGVHGHGVDVLDAVQDLDEHLPERRVHDQERLGAQVGAEQQHGQRDQGHRGDRAQELDGRGGGGPQGGDAADQQAERDPARDGQGQAEGPAHPRVREGE